MHYGNQDFRPYPALRPNAMAEALRNMQHCVHYCRDAVFVTDATGLLERVNPSFEKLTGYSSLAVLGRDLSSIAIGGASSPAYQQIWQQVFQGRMFRGVLELRTNDGGSLELDVTVLPVRDNKGTLASLVCTGRDLREQRKLEAQLYDLRRMEAIAALAGGLGHDFNNMLMIISAYAELALESISKEHPLWNRLQEIHAAAARATGLTRQLLAFGRRQQQQQLELVSLNAIVQETCRLLPRVIGEDIELSVALDDNVGHVKADVGQMQQILLNLALNARDAMPEGGTLRIETRAAQEEGKLPCNAGDHVELSVTDNGQGISPEDLPRIFEPFYTTKEEGKGNGLGLSMVQSIVKQNHGRITVDSKPGEGSSFRIYLPVANGRGTPAEVPREAANLTGGAETLLVAEDEPGVREAMAAFLSSVGYTVLQAANGEDALKQFQAHPENIDLIIADVVMPRMSGPRLAEKVAALRPGTRVLFVSAHSRSAVLRKGVSHLSHSFLQKPYSFETLSRKIREVLEKPQPQSRAAGAGAV